MKTKIVNGTFHFKRKRFIYLDEAIKPVKEISGELRIVENNGNTYVVIPVDSYINPDFMTLIYYNKYQGFMIPIIEDYDSLEEIK